MQCIHARQLPLCSKYDATQSTRISDVRSRSGTPKDHDWEHHIRPGNSISSLQDTGVGTPLPTTMMGRVTRKKAAEIAEQLHIDEDALLDISGDDAAIIKAKASTPDPTDRAPLGELAPNSADSINHSDDGGQELKKSVRGKKGGKKAAAKGKKNNLAASTASQPAEDPQDEVLPDDNDSAPSPASEKAAEDLMKDVPECK